MGRKKRTERITNNTESLVITKTKFKTAIYARLSKEDSGKENTDTFENQVAIIKDFIKTKEGLKVVGEYFDNGYKGTSFNRPEFNRLMDDIKKNKIDCIVVKDLSRLGRDYVEMGNLIEKLFPYLGVRFISISENFDSYNKSGDIMMPLTNIINEWYAKDISKKIKTAIIEKQKNGMFIGSNILYGYIRSSKDNALLEINDEVVEVVKLIFRYKVNGMSNLKIARKLNEMKIPSPSKYKYLKGIWKNKKYSTVIWREDVIRKILCNQKYIGNVVYGKVQVSYYEGKRKREQQPRDNWIVKKKIIPAIISDEIFENVQNIIEKSRKKYFDGLEKNKKIMNKENILIGKFVCGDCGKSMKRKRRIYNDRIIYNYGCGGYISSGSATCSLHSVNNEFALFESIRETIVEQIKLFLEVSDIIEKNKEFILLKLKTFNQVIKKQKQQVNKLKSKQSEIYEDYSEGILAKKKYLEYKKMYMLKFNYNKSVLERLIAEKNCYEKNMIKKEIINKISSINNIEVLTKEMIELFIDKIYCYENNRFDIILNFQDEYKSMLKYIDVIKC